MTATDTNVSSIPWSNCFGLLTSGLIDLSEASFDRSSERFREGEHTWEDLRRSWLGEERTGKNDRNARRRKTS